MNQSLFFKMFLRRRSRRAHLDSPSSLSDARADASHPDRNRTAKVDTAMDSSGPFLLHSSPGRSVTGLVAGPGSRAFLPPLASPCSKSETDEYA